MPALSDNRSERTPSDGDIDEAVLDRKVWWHIVPFVVILLVICILDRVNIGYAALTMNADLGIDPAFFGFLSGIFFISYVIFEVPSNQFLVRTGAVWLFRIMISWGIITVLIAFVQTPVELAILRFLLGAAEAGFTPGIMLYLTFWFRKTDLAGALRLFCRNPPGDGDRIAGLHLHSLPRSLVRPCGVALAFHAQRGPGDRFWGPDPCVPAGLPERCGLAPGARTCVAHIPA